MKMRRIIACEKAQGCEPS